MRHEVLLSPEAVNDLRRLRADPRSDVRDAIEAHLRHEPMKTGRSRIRRLRGPGRPRYRLRVGELRVFYDVVGATVQVLAIVFEADAAAWVAAVEQSDEEGRAV